MFIGALAIAHAVAFGSYWVQWRGLIGPSGILPLGQFLLAAHAQEGAQAWYDYPSLCWIFGSGRFLDVLCLLGMGLSVTLFLGYAQAVCLVLLWACYLSLVSAGQNFFDFQWDALLLESTAVAVWLVPWTLGRSRSYDPPVLARALGWWLLFRLMMLSGLVKLASGDPAWRNLTALTVHYETQPLPTPLAWYFHQMPLAVHKACCALMFAIELGGPLCIPGPRRVRHAGIVAMIFLQVMIALTGNYAFFNVLSVGLCLACLDDAWWLRVRSAVGMAPPRDRPAADRGGRGHATALRWFAAFAVGVTFFEAAASVYRGAARSPIVRNVAEAVGPFRTFNDYGLFRVMTLERPELVFEGSDDGRDWREYSFPYKPTDLDARPRWVAPYQPRLDWQLWFAALGPPDYSPWVETMCERLLQNDPAVLGLFSRNPFPTHPPQRVRVVRYLYEFTSRRERAETGNWWRRTPVDFYIPEMTAPTRSR
jgi:hypothetical protein